MAKKTNKSLKKVTRSTTMQKTIAEGRQFLASNSKKKRIVKSRTILETVKDAQNILEKRKAPVKKVTKTVLKKKASPKIAVPKEAVLKKSVNADDKKKVTKQKVVSKRGPKSALKPVCKPAEHLAPARSDSRLSNASIGKVTKFKTKSKDNLPLPAFGYIDVCFCVDATGSMIAELAQVQSTIVHIIEKVSTKVQTEGLTLRFAVVTYRDHPPQAKSYVTQVKDFSDDQQIRNYVKTLTANEGGDQPQAVHDGLLDCCQKLNWVQVPGTPILRYIFHIADAPPHGKEFTGLGTREGCTCGKQTKDVIMAINRKQIHYRLIKARPNIRLNTMEQIFRKGIADFDSTQISLAKQMDVRISDMIIYEMLPDFV